MKWMPHILVISLLLLVLAPVQSLASDATEADDDTTDPASENAAEAPGIDKATAAAANIETTNDDEDTMTDDEEVGVTYLVPSLKDAGYRVTDDTQKYKHRLSFSPAFGKLGTQDLFAFRVGYSPNTWLGYEVALGHNPASSLHALLHTFNVVLRYPLSWRLQPYGTLGYGMMTVFPGQALNADRVTKNTLTAGGGLEFYIRDDVALRGELRGATVIGQELNKDETVAYSYREFTIGFAFYRSLGR